MRHAISGLAGVLCLLLQALDANAAPPSRSSKPEVTRSSTKAASCAIEENGSQKVARHLTALLPQLRAVKNEIERESMLRLAAVALARGDDHHAALKVAGMIPERQWDDNIRDEVRRLHARRLARFGNAEDATKIASQIKGEYSRADALLAIARSHLRAKNTTAVNEVLRKVDSLIRDSKSPLAISYLAWLFTRVGEHESARSLFQLAATIKLSDERNEALLGNRQKQHVAFYQAKAGWTDDALQTVGDDLKNLPPLKAVLLERHQGELLHRFAEKLPAMQAVNFLADLAASQTTTGQIESAQETLQLALARFAQVDKVQQNSPDGIYIQTILSVLEIATGQALAGRTRFATVSKLPGFTADHAATFYNLLVVPSPFVKVSLAPQQQAKEEQAALAAMKKLKTSQIYNFIEIGRAQHKRGDKTAMRETLKLAKAAVRAKLATRPKTAPRNAREPNFEDAIAAGQLMTIAKIERDAGDTKAAQSTLAQAKALMHKHSQLALAAAFLNATFNLEAGVLLEKNAPLPIKKSIDWLSEDTLQVLGPRHTRQAGVDAALRWVVKIPDAQLRAMTLSGILIALNPIPVEERELILRGNKLKGARVSSQFSLPGYLVSENFNEFE